jgi:ABC-type multidrug transport system ATPase subunit
MGALCGNEFEGSFYDCPFEGGRANPACAPFTGAFIMDSLGFPTNWVWRPLAVMGGFVVFFVALAWIGLAFFKVETTVARQRPMSLATTDLSVGKEQLTTTRAVAEVHTVNVSLDRFSLDLHKRSALGRKLPVKKILNPITTTFQAGRLNVIMGPSGSGKTSLLNAIAHRLVGSIGTRYRTGGRMLFNGAEPSDSVVQSVCSYVCQTDDALLPSLTVRETLRFAACLRLPSWMQKTEKLRRAEDVLLKMGLKDCADVLVGGGLVKGISGGEKRRVSIAVQILTDPRVLLLDEPTSGLDAFTAASLIEILNGLAREGRTVVMTIHQARSDLFRHFGNVLLLARGGSPVYAGSATNMLGYMGQMGYDCPLNTNPADFALDLITVDLQNAYREASSRAKVTRLIDTWDALVRTAGDQAIMAAPSRRTAGAVAMTAPAELGLLARERASLIVSLPILLQRATINFFRQPPLMMARTMQVIGYGATLTLFVAPIGSDFYSVQTRIGFVQQVCAIFFVGMLQNVAVYPAERDIFYRESDDGVVSAEAFLLTYTILEIPFEIISALIFAVLIDLVVGLPRTLVTYFTASFVTFAIVSCGESLGIVFNTMFSDHTGFAISLTSIVLSVAQTMGGVLSIDMPAPLQALNYASPIRYAVRAFATTSLRGVSFSCDAAHTGPDGRCIISTGTQVLQLFKMDVGTLMNVVGLAVCVVAYRLIAWALLRIVRTKWR